MAGVGLVRRKKVVVLQCRHILHVNQYNYGGHQHQHHRHHRSVHRHFDIGNTRFIGHEKSVARHKLRRTITFSPPEKVRASKMKTRG